MLEDTIRIKTTVSLLDSIELLSTTLLLSNDRTSKHYKNVFSDRRMHSYLKKNMYEWSCYMVEISSNLRILQTWLDLDTMCRYHNLYIENNAFYHRMNWYPRLFGSIESSESQIVNPHRRYENAQFDRFYCTRSITSSVWFRIIK